MKNKEKYAEEILELACSGKQFAIDKRTGKITLCQDTECEECLFNSENYCVATKKEWAEAEYKEPPTNDLISRDALKKALHNFFDGKVIDEPAYILRDVLSIIDNAPTTSPYKAFKMSFPSSTEDGSWIAKTSEMAAYADMTEKSIKERPQGEWIIIKDKRYGDNVKCPFCGKEIAGTDLNFCCKCGAKLTGSEKMNGGAE